MVRVSSRGPHIVASRIGFFSTPSWTSEARAMAGWDCSKLPFKKCKTELASMTWLATPSWTSEARAMAGWDCFKFPPKKCKTELASKRWLGVHWEPETIFLEHGKIGSEVRRRVFADWMRMVAAVVGLRRLRRLGPPPRKAPPVAPTPVPVKNPPLPISSQLGPPPPLLGPPPLKAPPVAPTAVPVKKPPLPTSSKLGPPPPLLGPPPPFKHPPHGMPPPPGMPPKTPVTQNAVEDRARLIVEQLRRRAA